MRRLEERAFWPKLLEVKDDLSLRELAERFGVTPGAISAAFKRTGIPRKHAPPGPRRNRGSRRRSAAPPPTTADGRPVPRPGSKDAAIVPYFDLLGRIPDTEVAEKAGVTAVTVAKYRNLHGIDAYVRGRSTGPSETDASSANRSGTHPSAAGDQLGSNAATDVPPGANGSALFAWNVTFAGSAGEIGRVVVASDVVEAAREAQQASWLGEVEGLALAGQILEGAAG